MDFLFLNINTYSVLNVVSHFDLSNWLYQVYCILTQSTGSHF